MKEQVVCKTKEVRGGTMQIFVNTFTGKDRYFRC